MRRFGSVGVAVVLLSACAGPATPPRLSASFAETFAGLYVAQQTQLGRTDVTRPSLQTRASCLRSGPQQEDPGEDWQCAVRYVDSDAEATQAFEVQVKPDGCWKAEGAPTLQPALLRDPVTGRSRVNALAEFDGCLDTSW